MRSALLGMFLIILVSPAAWAQTGKHLAIGGGLGLTNYTDKDFSSKNPSVSLAYRINLKTDAKDGWSWAPKSGLGWSRRNTSSDIGGLRTPLGKLQTILVMAGIQRGLRQGPWQVGFGVVAGAAIHKFDVDRAARAAAINVKNSIAVKPEISAWYDLNQWFAVQGSLSYLFDRPKADTVTLGGPNTTATWTTDHASASLGLVVGIF